MITFAVTRRGYEAVRDRGGDLPSRLWVGMDVLSDSEIAQLRAGGTEVTNFTRRIDPTDRAVEAAIATIAEHHPGQHIVVEGGHDV